MPALVWVAWSWISSAWGGFLLPLLAKIPWQVWAGIAGVIAVLYYGHVREQRGYQKCHVEWQKATDTEVARQAEVSNRVLREAQERAVVAERKSQEANDEAAKLQKDVDQLKTAKNVCLPGSITGRYRK